MVILYFHTLLTTNLNDDYCRPQVIRVVALYFLIHCITSLGDGVIPIPHLRLPEACYWQNVCVPVPCNLEVWQRPEGSDVYKRYDIPLRNHQRTSDRRRERVDILQCVECQAVWPAIATLGVARATDHGLIEWSRPKVADQKSFWWSY